MCGVEGMIELDIEGTKIIKGAPVTASKPTGVALGIPQPDGSTQRLYLAWGHPDGNNTTVAGAKAVLEKYWHEEFLTHNGGGFDVPVLADFFDLPERDPLLTHDTLFGSYLFNPHAPSLKLKDLAENWCGMAPDEQTELNDWIMANVKECTSRKECGAYISETPVSICGPYAVGDIVRTKALWDYVLPTVLEQKEAYQREQRLAPILNRIRQGGILIDHVRLAEDYAKANVKLALISDLIRQHIKVGPDFELKDATLAARLLELGYEGFLLTPKGKTSMAKPSLEAALGADPVLRSMLKTKATLDTLTGTFMGPWLRYCKENNGRIHPSYNQVRNPEGYGTRTGRLSSNDPNGQNIPKDLGLDYWGDPFPDMRSYCLPEPGQVWFCGDFKAQEPRLTAHFEGGAFMEAFQENPNLDPYMFVVDACGGIVRKEAKVVLLGLIYAMGVQKLADDLGCDTGRATILRNAIKAAIPDVVALDNECKKRFRMGLPIRTLGGRIYYCEPPSNGRTWDYKALNTLIQGSAADQNKEAMIYLEPRIIGLDGRLLGTVHDEISSSIWGKDRALVTEIYSEAANALACDVPMLFDCECGPNWGAAKP